MEDLKYDKGKPRVDLIEPEFVLGIAKVLAHGAEKYKPESWKTEVKDPENRYYAAAMRHLLAWKSGEVLDSDSGECHLLHAACNLMFLDFFERKRYE